MKPWIGRRSTPASGCLSIVIPAYNEEQNVRRVYEAIQSALRGRETIEVIFVDDGSTDGTADCIRNLRAQDSSVRLIRFGRNFGQQPALVADIEATRFPRRQWKCGWHR
jgi:glycosyltransferase involved in cell wall biosynthesis